MVRLIIFMGQFLFLFKMTSSRRCNAWQYGWFCLGKWGTSSYKNLCRTLHTSKIHQKSWIQNNFCRASRPPYVWGEQWFLTAEKNMTPSQDNENTESTECTLLLGASKLSKSVACKCISFLVIPIQQCQTSNFNLLHI